jgi:NTE family protein
MQITTSETDVLFLMQGPLGLIKLFELCFNASKPSPISHTQYTAMTQGYTQSSCHSIKVLDIISTVPARPLIVKSTHHTPLSRYARVGCVKYERDIQMLCKVLTLLIVLTFLYPFKVESVENKAPSKAPVIGLVLSGGGARGAAHIGVLKVLEELRIPVDIITGTSMGAIVGGMYAQGYSVEEIEKHLLETDWDVMFRDEPPRKARSFRRKQDDYNFLIKQEAGIKNGHLIIPKGLLQGQQLSLRLKSLTLMAPTDFDALPIRFRAIAADIESGETVVMKDGSLATAMLASMAIPGVIAPVEWDGRLLIDGGFSNNLPIQVARDLGAEVLIVVDLSSKPHGRESQTSPLSIFNQILGITIQRNTAQQLKKLSSDDILIQPNLDDFASADFWQTSKMIDIGVGAARAHTRRLMRLSIAPKDYKDFLFVARQRESTLPRIDQISFDNQTSLSTDVLKSHIAVKTGKKLDIPTLEEDIHRLYGLNIFERVEYDLLRDDKAAELRIGADEKEWGPQYLRFGLVMETNFEGDGIFNAASSYTITPINALGGEWRSEVQIGHDQHIATELYQPIDNRLQYYIRTVLGHYEVHYGQFESGQQIADMDVSYSDFLLAGGHQLGNWGQLEAGAYFASSNYSPHIGNLSTSSQDSRVGAWTVSLSYDHLDNINIPKLGSMAGIRWIATRDKLGADNERDQLEMNGIWAGTWDKHTLVLWAGIAGVLDTEVPADHTYAIGGLFNLSGYQKQELSGRYAGVMRLIYLKELGESRSVLKVPVYLGISLEAGNAWNERREIRFDSLRLAGSVSLAIDSPIGPIYLAHGYAEGGKRAKYLYLGRTFSFF